MRTGVEIPRMRFEPAGRVVDIGQRSRVGRNARDAEIERCNKQAMSCELRVDGPIFQPVILEPAAAVNVNQHRVRTWSLRLVDAGEPPSVPIVSILDVPGLHL